MPLILSKEAFAEIVGAVVYSEPLAQGEISLDALSAEDIANCRTNGAALPPPDGRGLYAMFAAMTATQDGPFVQLALEAMLKGNADDGYAPLILEFSNQEDLEPVLAMLYRIVWGDLPPGPAPTIQFVRSWPEGQRAYDSKVWAQHRERLYGPPPYAHEDLRAHAFSTTEPAGTPEAPIAQDREEVKGPGWRATPAGTGYDLSFDPGGHVPQIVTVRIDAAALSKLARGSDFDAIVAPLMKKQGIKVL